MIKIENNEKQTNVEFFGCADDLKYEIITFLECLENLMPDYNFHSLKKDVSKIDFDRGI